MVDVETLRTAESDGADIVYAVGDIHGRLDLLTELERLIDADIAATRPIRPLRCYLGDYIDRGPCSAQVIDYLSEHTGDGDRVFLRGNHEDRMLAFLDDPREYGPAWVMWGGRNALESYGLSVPEEPAEAQWLELGAALRSALPPTHYRFLHDLRLGLRWRDYLFVHAGLNPDHSPSAQPEHDLMWIREPFSSSRRDWGFRVVHGHVIVDEPVFRDNRIGIDTGAYDTNVLTCAVVGAAEVRLLQTGG